VAVTIRILSPLSMRLGLADGPRPVTLEEELEPGATGLQLLRRLAERYPAIAGMVLDADLTSILPTVIVTVDKRRIGGQRDLHRVLEDRAQILIMPPMAGG
jgi:molybdopterin converting factor small subunit